MTCEAHFLLFVLSKRKGKKKETERKGEGKGKREGTRKEKEKQKEKEKEKKKRKRQDHDLTLQSPHIPENTDPQLVDLLTRILEKYPAKRIKMPELRVRLYTRAHAHRYGMGSHCATRNTLG